MRLAAHRVDRPDAETALERYRLAVRGNRRPQHTAVLEGGEGARGVRRSGARTGGDLLRPNVLCAAAIRHEVQRPAVGAPHRPCVLRAAFRDRLVDWTVAHEPNLALVEMAVA